MSRVSRGDFNRGRVLARLWVAGKRKKKGIGNEVKGIEEVELRGNEGRNAA